jgi:hypothetical protein
MREHQMTGPDNTQSPDAPPPTAPPPAAPPPAPSAPSPMASMVSSMSQAEMLVVGGAVLLLGLDLIFGILLRDFYAGDLIWLASALVLIAFLVSRRAAGSLPFKYETILLVAGGAVLLLGARDIVIEVYFILRRSFDVNATYLLGALIFIVGVVAMGVGAWQLWRGRR